MKLRLTALLTFALLSGSIASYIDLNYQYAFYDYFGALSGDVKNKFTGAWAVTSPGGDAQIFTNNTTAASNIGFLRGDKSGATPSATLYILHNVTGTIGELPWLGGPANQTEVIFGKNASLTSGSKAIIVSAHRDTDATMGGSWTIRGGTITGGGNNEVFFVGRTAGKIVMDSTSFYAGSSVNGAPAKDAVHIESANGGLTISNSRGDTNMTFKAVTYTGGRKHTTANGNLQVQGKTGTFHGVYVDGGFGLGFGGGSTVPINMTGGGNFIGSQVDSLDVRSAEYIGDYYEKVYASAEGGGGIYTAGSASAINGTYTFIAGAAGNATVGGINSYALADGGNGFDVGGNGTVETATCIGGDAGEAIVVDVLRSFQGSNVVNEVYSSVNCTAYASGGNGLRIGGTATLTDVKAYGASAGRAVANDFGSLAVADGGNGLLAGQASITGGYFEGAKGGRASSRKGIASAIGGSGVFVRGNTVINGGTFVGSEGGSVSGVKQVDGAGVWVSSGTLTFNGGTAIGSGIENGPRGNIAIMLDNVGMTMTENVTNSLLVGNLVANNRISKSVTINNGTINGDIIKGDTGTLNLTISTNATFSGTLAQYNGTVNVKFTSPNQGQIYTNVVVNNGTMNFTDGHFVTAKGASFSLASTNAALNFNSVDLSEGTTINAGNATVTSSGDFAMGNGSSIFITTNFQGSAGGMLNVGGTLNVTNKGAKFYLSGIANTSSGSHVFAKFSSLSLGSNTVDNLVVADYGWLTKIASIDNTGNSLVANWEYNTLANSSLGDLPASVITYLDTIIETNDMFYALNSSGEVDSGNIIRYTISQLPDLSEASFRVSRQINDQISTRGSEFRSKYAMASTSPRFGNTPAGAAGPGSLDEEDSMQGWIKIHGTAGEEDATGNFKAYDSSSFGSIFGIDKSFGNVLVGVAGGYARTQIDSDVYKADANTYHGSLYSTVGAESLFIDMALTYGAGDADEESDDGISQGEFDFESYSAYLGAGYDLPLGKMFSIIPEASILASFFGQDEYDRTGALGVNTIGAYDTESYLGSVGVTVAYKHEFEMLKYSMGYMPELRVHYLHEFNADPDNFNYTIGGIENSFAVRPRDEDLTRLGIGFNIWSDNYLNTRLELDYDALISDLYFEHIFSGKVSWSF